MTANAFEIQVQDDHLERIAQPRNPILALTELIWNAVYAFAAHMDEQQQCWRCSCPPEVLMKAALSAG